MSAHAAAPTRTTKIRRALAGVAVLAALAGVGQVTYSVWSAQGDATSPISTGRVAVTVNGGGSYSIPPETFANLKPGDTKQFTLTIANTGTLPGSLALAVDNGGTSSPLPGALALTVNDGFGTVHAGNLAAGVKPLTGAAVLEPGQTATYTLSVTLPADAAANLQGQTFTTTLNLTLTQA